MENLIGKTLGQYQVISLAGKGGMAVVYKAFQPSLNRYVALKVLPEYLAQDDEFVLRFEHEARAAAALRHPNIMVVYDVGKEGDVHYISAEFLEGHTLSEVIAQQRGPLPLPRVAAIMNQVASALDFAHQRGLVHRDIKPSNVFVGAEDHVTLMDFGIAKALQGGQQMTRTGMMVGTPEYMSPEQAEGRPLDQRSDIYSLGIMLYQLLTGRVPFSAETPTAVLLAHVTQQPVPPSRLNSAIPPAVEAVVLRSIAKRPEERFASAGALARELARAVSEAPAVMPGMAASAIPPTVTTGHPPYTPPPAQYSAPSAQYSAPSAQYSAPVAPRTPPPVQGTAPQAPYSAPSAPYSAPSSYPPAKKSGGPNVLLWIGLGLAGLFVVCIMGFGGLYLIGKSSSTPTPTAPRVALATPTEPPVVRATPMPLAAATKPGVPTPTSKSAAATPPAASGAGVLFTEDFASQKASEDKGWSFEAGDNVDYTWSANKLTISVKKKQWIGWDTPSGTFDDFGAEVEAQAVGSDYASYGLILRVSGSGDTRSYYTFGVTTDGKYYLQKRVDGQWAETDPIKPTASSAVKAGANKNVLRLLANGSRLTLYVNGTQLATVTDTAISSGKLGLFAATGSNNAQAQVIFNRLIVLAPDKAVAAWGAPQVSAGAVLYEDDFGNPDSGWSVKETDNSVKYYKDGKYYIKLKNPSYTSWGTPEDSYYVGGVVVDVDATLTEGPTDNDLGVLCHFQDNDNFYYLAISSDGYAGIMKESGGEGLKTVSGNGKMQTSAAIKKGVGATNHIRAICDVGKLTLIINGTTVVELEDAEFEDGGVGLVASSYKTGGGVVVAFDNVVVSEIQ